MKFALLGSVFLFLHACVNQGLQSPAPVSAERTVEDISHWQFKGKLGIRATLADGQKLRESANLSWNQTDQHYALFLSGPFGQGATRIKGNPDRMSIQQGGQKHSARDAEQLLEQTLGFPLPINALPYWVKGLPLPGTEFNTQTETQLEASNPPGNAIPTGIDNQGSAIAVGQRPQQLQQAGWTINYARYQDVQHLRLPGKITLSRDQVRLTLIIKQWTLQ